VSQVSGFSVENIVGLSHNRNVAKARHLACWLARLKTRQSFIVIAKSFGNRDHSTILNSCSCVDKNEHFYSEMKANALALLERI
jgi:chromosomal replication initiation ATPase DnaA